MRRKSRGWFSTTSIGRSSSCWMKFWMCWSCGRVFHLTFIGARIQLLGSKLLRNQIPTPAKIKWGMFVLLASADPFVTGSSAAARSRSGSWLLFLQFSVSILGFVRKTWTCYILIMEGVMWGHFLLPPVLSGDTVSVQVQRHERWPICYFEANIWMQIGSIVISDCLLY